MRRITLSALALVGSLSVTGIVRAGCCDDFWGCLGAVATGGLSCQIQSIIDTVNSMKQLVDTMGNEMRTKSSQTMAQAQKMVGDAMGDVKQMREQSMTDLQKMVEKAHEIATPPTDRNAMAPGVIGGSALQKGNMVAKPGAVLPAPAAAAAGGLKAAPLGTPLAVGNANAAAAPKLGDGQAIKDALARADAYMQDLRSKANAPAAEVSNAEQAAVRAAAQHMQTAAQIGLDIAITPLKLLGDSLLGLLTHPERIFDPTAQIDADIQNINAQIPAMFDRISNEVSQEAMGDLQRVKGTLQQMQDSSAAGQAIVDSMQKLANSKLQSDLDALDRLVPKPPPGVTLASRGIMLPTTGFASNRTLITAAFTRADPAKLPIVIQQRAAVVDLATKWQTIKVRIKAPVQIEAGSVQKVDHDLGQMYTGKAKGEFGKKKTELLEEAKKHFANDPKTLEKVKQYIEAHSPRD